MYTASCISPLRPTSIRAYLWAAEPWSVTLPEKSLWHPGYPIYLIKRLMWNAKNLINASAPYVPKLVRLFSVYIGFAPQLEWLVSRHVFGLTVPSWLKIDSITGRNKTNTYWLIISWQCNHLRITNRIANFYYWTANIRHKKLKKH